MAKSRQLLFERIEPMNIDDLQGLLDAGYAHSAVIDVREVDEALGYLRTVTIHQGNEVTIEYERCSDYLAGENEGYGLKYVGTYHSLIVLVASLEKFLNRSIDRWSDYTAQPFSPIHIHEVDPDANLRHFEDLVRGRRMILPEGAVFEIAGIYFRHIELFGEYRRDRLGEETEIWHRELGIDDVDTPED